MNIEWIDVLIHFERNGYVRNGLTLPFLIGYKDVLQPGASLQSVRRFIEAASNRPGGITVMNCGDIGGFVFGTLDNETEKMRKQHKGLYTEFGNIIVTDHSFNGCNNLEAVISVLERTHSGHIAAKHFSKNAGRWQYYSPLEQNRIRELVQK